MFGRKRTSVNALTSDMQSGPSGVVPPPDTNVGIDMGAASRNSDTSSGRAIQPVNVPVRNYRNMSSNPAAQQYSRAWNDYTPINFRRYVDASGVQSIQLRNPVAHTTRRRLTYHAAGYLFAQMPSIPGQMRDNAGGFHSRGIDPLSYQAMWDNGPGSQPANPGGPARIASPQFINPMSGT
jgi:hypothetical protein